jgi:DNA gyrase/topoisomerase IV subunit A
VADKELTGIVGPPYFLTGCIVTGNLAALAAGRRTELRLQAQVSISDDRSKVVIENIPPNISTDDAAQIIANRARGRRWASEHSRLHHITQLPLANLADETTERTSPFGRFICTPKRDTSPQQLRDALLDVPGVYTTMPVALPQPLPTLIKHWVRAYAHEDLSGSLATLDQAIHGQGR